MQNACGTCQLDYTKSDSGDGPAVFAIFIVGFVAVAVAFVVRFSWDAPLGVALLISIGAAFGLTALILRPLKATMIALQFTHKAEEGKLSKSADTDVT